MSISQMSDVLRQLRTSALLRNTAGRTDGQMLEDFVKRHDEAALAALVHRHGPMVWGVCRRVLRHHHNAEDAFQATFLVFVRKAASIASRELLGNWLYGVAHQTALKARATRAKRNERERQVTPMPEPAVAERDVWRDLQPVLDQELSRLPDKYRGVIVLCDLEGKSRKEAARHLGVPEGTVAGRLARARTMLAKRLARQGVTLSGGALAALIANNVASAMPTPVLTSTIRAASLFAADQAAAGISVRVAALTEGVLKTMCNSNGKLALCAALAIGLITAGWGLYGTQAADPERNAIDVVAPAKGEPAKDEPAKEALDLPAGSPPTQVLASLADGKLVIKMKVPVVRAVPGGVNGFPVPVAPGGGAGGGGAPGGAPGNLVWEVRPMTFDLEDVEVLDTQAKKLAPKDVMMMLKTETLALAAFSFQPVDPLHLRLFKPGTMTFVLPMPRVAPGGPGVVPPPIVVPPAIVPPAVPPRVLPAPGGAPGAPGGNFPGGGGAAPADPLAPGLPGR